MQIYNCTTPRHFVTLFNNLDGAVSVDLAYTIVDQMKDQLGKQAIAKLQCHPSTPSNVYCCISEYFAEMGM